MLKSKNYPRLKGKMTTLRDHLDLVGHVCDDHCEHGIMDSSGTKMKNTIIKIVWSLMLIGLVALVGHLFMTVVNESEIAECTKLESLSRENNPVFFITEWQREMCLTHEIHINARIHQPDDN